MILTNVGKIFEQKFKESIPKDVAVIRLHDSASGFGQDSGSTRFSMKSPFDFILFKTPCMYCLELKSTDKKSFSFEREKPLLNEKFIGIKFKLLLSIISIVIVYVVLC